MDLLCGWERKSQPLWHWKSGIGHYNFTRTSDLEVILCKELEEMSFGLAFSSASSTGSNANQQERI